MRRERLEADSVMRDLSLETDMTAIAIEADIKAKWPQGHCSHSPANPEELMIIAVDLLIKELGTDGARTFIRCSAGIRQPGCLPDALDQGYMITSSAPDARSADRRTPERRHSQPRRHSAAA